MASIDTKNKPLVDLVAVRLLLKRHWPAIVAATLLGAGVAWLFSSLAVKQYTANSSGIVVVRSSNDVGGALTGDSIAKSKASQYQSLAQSRTVAEEALKIAHVSGDPDAVAAGITVAVPQDSPQIEIKVTRPDASEAQRLANAWITALGKQVDQLSAESGLSGSSDQSQNGQNSSRDSSDNQSKDGSVISLKPYVKATEPVSPSSPRTKLNVALGALAGLILGLLYAMGRSRSDKRIRGTDVIERDFGLSVVGTLPNREHSDSRAFLLDTLGRRVSKQAFRSVESFNELRANLQFMKPDHPPKAVVISSALPEEGKSTVAANLAISVAQSGRNVVLVDGDLRRPTVAGTFGLVPDVGVTTAVTGQGDATAMLQDVHGIDTLKILAAGQTPPNPSEIVGSSAFAKMIEELSQHAFVIIDAPPVIPVADAAIMARRFDGALLVLNAGKAQTDQLQKALSVMDKVDAEILGVILNRVPTNKLESSQYGYYGDYAYAYTSEEGKAKKMTKRDRRRSEGRYNTSGEAEINVPADKLEPTEAAVTAVDPSSENVQERKRTRSDSVPPVRRRRRNS